MSHFRREAKETPKRVIRAYEATVRAWQAEPLLRPGGDGVLRHVTPAEQADAFPMREESRRDIERRAAMVDGLSAREAALVFWRAGECGEAVLECLGIEKP